MYRCAYCKKVIIADLEEIVVIADEILVHKPHEKPMLKRIQREGIVKVLKEVAVACVVLFLFAIPATGQLTPDRHACTYVLDAIGEPHFKDAIYVVGEKEGMDEDGKPVQEWWVWFPDRIQELHRNGRAINFPKSKVVFMNPKWKQPIIVKGRRCKLWDLPDSGMTAER